VRVVGRKEGDVQPRSKVSLLLAPWSERGTQGTRLVDVCVSWRVIQVSTALEA